MLVPRSKLFVHGDCLDTVADALRASPDALSIDLEDGVAEDAKTTACQAVAHFLAANRLPCKVWVRVNGIQSGRLTTDILALAGTHVDVVNLPKAESPLDIALVEQLLLAIEASSGRTTPIRIVPTIESACGLRNAASIALASNRVIAIQLGAADLTRASGIDYRGPGLEVIQTMLSLAATEAGVAALDSTPHGMAEIATFEADAARSRALGYRGKSCMQSWQVAIANRIYGGPTAG